MRDQIGRLLDGGADALADYEVLEYLLFAAQSRGDTKPIAKALIARFGSLAKVLNADPATLAQVDGMGEASAAALRIVAVAARRMAFREVEQQPVLRPCCPGALGNSPTTSSLPS